MTTSYDAIVVGARCAGSPTAMLLARAGHRVLLVDRARFPSDTLSSHYIHQPGIARLRRWGLLPEVARSGCPPVRATTFDLGPLRLRGDPYPSEGVADGYAVRRTVLDHILVRAAVAAGAEVRERFSVRELVRENGRVTGIRGPAAGGAEVTERARIVIGADGMSSMVARSVGAPTYDAHPARTCAYYSYWSGVELDGPHLCSVPGNTAIAVPTNDGQVVVTAYWPVAEFHRVRADVEGSFWEALARMPALAERLSPGTRVARFRGTATLPNFLRRPHGDGWALVGDAGYHKDPILALGITDAFIGAELLAEAVDAGLSGRRPMAEALADYERERNAAAANGYRSTLDLARLEPPPPEVQELIAALAHDPDQFGRFIGTMIGSYPPERFFAPESIAAIMARRPAMEAAPAATAI